ncbi:MAG TPA: hypothetical protein VFB59_04060 [Candidatus Saccharimonadales bacterium]|nr:hypothetical protein [Candidatus Saccharimonadales bacterium]
MKEVGNHAFLDELSAAYADIAPYVGESGVGATLHGLELRSTGSENRTTVVSDARALADLLTTEGFIVTEPSSPKQTKMVLYPEEAAEARITLQQLKTRGASAEDIAFVEAALASLDSSEQI